MIQVACDADSLLRILNPFHFSSLDRPVQVSALNTWYPVEEVWYPDAAGERWLKVPYGLSVILRHNYMWPIWLNEGPYGEGSHRLYIPYGWNKFQVLLDPRTPYGGTVVWTIPEYRDQNLSSAWRGSLRSATPSFSTAGLEFFENYLTQCPLRAFYSISARCTGPIFVLPAKAAIMPTV